MTPQRQSNRGFGLAFAALFAIVAGAIWWLADAVPVWAVSVAAVFLVLALGAPWLLMPVNRLWAAFLVRFSVVSNAIVLAVVFYGVLLPTSSIVRALGYDSMARRKSDAASFWLPVKRGTTRETLPDLF